MQLVSLIKLMISLPIPLYNLKVKFIAISGSTFHFRAYPGFSGGLRGEYGHFGIFNSFLNDTKYCC